MSSSSSFITKLKSIIGPVELTWKTAQDYSLLLLGALVQAEATPGRGFIRHHNLRRTTTVEANLDKAITDTTVANDIVKTEWEKIRAQHPGIDLDILATITSPAGSVLCLLQRYRLFQKAGCICEGCRSALSRGNLR